MKLKAAGVLLTFLYLLRRIRNLKKENYDTSVHLRYCEEKLEQLIDLADTNTLKRFKQELDKDVEFFDIVNNMEGKKV